MAGARLPGADRREGEKQEGAKEGTEARAGGRGREEHKGEGNPGTAKGPEREGETPGKQTGPPRPASPARAERHPGRNARSQAPPRSPEKKGHHGRARAKTPNQAAQKPRSPRGMRGPTPSERLSNKDLIAQSR